MDTGWWRVVEEVEGRNPILIPFRKAEKSLN